MSDAFRVNNNQYSWGSIRLKIAGEDYFGFTAISFGDKRERVKAYGMGRHHAPRGRSRGKYTIEPVKLTGWKGSVEAARAALALRVQGGDAGTSYSDVEFQIVVLYSEIDETPLIVEIDGCVWVGSTTAHEEAPENLKEEIEIDAMVIRRNGLALFDESQGSPV
jgi:hypothetical protein